jgi:hypothetical protein
MIPQRGASCCGACQVNPRDQFKRALIQVNRHRLLRRGTSYGPLLPEGVMQDDGVDR